MIDTGTDKRYVRQRADGTFKKSDEAGSRWRRIDEEGEGQEGTEGPRRLMAIVRSIAPAPRATDTVSVQFPDDDTVYVGTVVGMLAPQRGRKIALVRLAVEQRDRVNPRQDDFRAVWFGAKPGVEDWAEVAQMPQTTQAACFPAERP